MPTQELIWDDGSEALSAPATPRALPTPTEIEDPGTDNAVLSPRDALTVFARAGKLEPSAEDIDGDGPLYPGKPIQAAE